MSDDSVLCLQVDDLCKLSRSSLSFSSFRQRSKIVEVVDASGDVFGFALMRLPVAGCVT